MINGLRFSFLFIFISFFQPAFAQKNIASQLSNKRVEQSNLFGNNIESQCQHQVTKLANIKAFTQTNTFEHNISELERQLIPAYNLLFESYLYANVSPKQSIRKDAEQCQLTLAAQIDITLASKAMSELLNASKPLMTSDLQIRVYNKYLKKHKELSNSDFLSLKQQAKVAGNQFRKNTSLTVSSKFKLANECSKALEPKYHKRFVVNGTIVAPLTSKNYATLIKRVNNETCRKQVYSQYQGRHKQLNQDNLLSFIHLQNQKAQALGFATFAEYSLQNTSFKKIEHVHAFLSAISAQQEPSSAPWNSKFDEYSKTKIITEKDNNIESKQKRITPQRAQKGLFSLLKNEFGLDVKPLNGAVWHESVKGYQLTQNSNVLGTFYLDLYPREGKYKKNRHRAIKRGVSGVQLASSALILNLPHKNWQQKHVKSFFHEFGHLLHNLMAQQPYHIIAGISLENDLVEMPAKWFEWLSFSPVMQQKMFDEVLFTGEKPDAGTRFKMRLYRSALALTYFNEPVTKQNIDDISKRLSLQYLGFPYVPGADSQYSFSHLGTYGPRYYNYIWSEKVAQKLLADFLNNRFTGQDFTLALFAQGGRINMAEMLSLLYKKSISMTDIIKWVNNEKEF